MASPDAAKPFAPEKKPRAQFQRRTEIEYNAGGVLEYIARSADHHCLVTLWNVYEQRKRSPEQVTRRDVMVSPEFITFASKLENSRPKRGEYTRYNLRALDCLIMLYRNSHASITDASFVQAFEEIPL